MRLPMRYLALLAVVVVRATARATFWWRAYTTFIAANAAAALNDILGFGLVRG